MKRRQFKKTYKKTMIAENGRALGYAIYLDSCVRFDGVFGDFNVIKRLQRKNGSKRPF